MFDSPANSPALLSFEVLNAGVQVTNATVTVTVVSPAGTALVTAVAAAHAGDGVYTYLLSASHTSSLGTYRVTWNASNYGPNNSLTQVHQDYLVVNYRSRHMLTRLEARHSISPQVESADSFFTGTLGAGNTTTTLIDPERIESANQLKGWWLTFFTGANAGVERRIVSSQPIAAHMTLGLALPVAPAEGDQYELHRYLPASHYNAAIRRAVLDVADLSLVPVEAALTLESDTHSYAIPAGFDGIYEVAIRVTQTGDRYATIGPAIWKINRATRRLEVDWRVIGGYPSYEVRVAGRRLPYDPVSDGSVIEVTPASFVLDQAAAFLCQERLHSGQADPSGWGQKFQAFQGRAEATRGRLLKSVPPNYRRV